MFYTCSTYSRILETSLDIEIALAADVLLQYYTLERERELLLFSSQVQPLLELQWGICARLPLLLLSELTMASGSEKTGSASQS